MAPSSVRAERESSNAMVSPPRVSENSEPFSNTSTACVVPGATSVRRNADASGSLVRENHTDTTINAATAAAEYHAQWVVSKI